MVKVPHGFIGTALGRISEERTDWRYFEVPQFRDLYEAMVILAGKALDKSGCGKIAEVMKEKNALRVSFPNTIGLRLVPGECVTGTNVFENKTEFTAFFMGEPCLAFTHSVFDRAEQTSRIYVPNTESDFMNVFHHIAHMEIPPYAPGTQLWELQ